MIKPTVGRVVWVSRPHDAHDVTQPEAGLIVYVHNDRKVNVAGFDQSGAPFSCTSIPLLQDDDAKPDSRFAMWMPFQVGQAKAQQADLGKASTGEPTDPTPPEPVVPSQG